LLERKQKQNSHQILWWSFIVILMYIILPNKVGFSPISWSARGCARWQYRVAE